jgi:hypothetical protein
MMGYRSEVAYTIRFITASQVASGEKQGDAEEADLAKCRESFYTFIAEAKTNEETRPCFNELVESEFKSKVEGLRIDEENLQINFYADYVKWYPDFLDVKCHNSLFSLADEWANNEDNPNPYIGAVFVRLGENLDDVEEMRIGTGDWDWAYTSRQIVTDWL